MEERLAADRGSALTTPPPVSSNFSRSSEITICGLVRPCEMAFDHVGKVVHVDHRALDAAAASRSST